VGQVVVALDKDLGKILHNHGLTNLDNHLKRDEYTYELDLGIGYIESDLRPLTKRERGQ
jgi:hypothetical protein